VAFEVAVALLLPDGHVFAPLMCLAICERGDTDTIFDSSCTTFLQASCLKSDVCDSKVAEACVVSFDFRTTLECRLIWDHKLAIICVLTSQSGHVTTCKSSSEACIGCVDLILAVASLASRAVEAK
jgi:hypothetical protein